MLKNPTRSIGRPDALPLWVPSLRWLPRASTACSREVKSWLPCTSLHALLSTSSCPRTCACTQCLIPQVCTPCPWKQCPTGRCLSPMSACGSHITLHACTSLNALLSTSICKSAVACSACVSVFHHTVYVCIFNVKQSSTARFGQGTMTAGANLGQCG